METEYEKNQRQAREYQEQQQRFADDYAKKQDELKKSQQILTPQQVQQNLNTLQTPAGRQIAQSHAKFLQATPDQQQQMTAELLAQDNRGQNVDLGQSPPRPPRDKEIGSHGVSFQTPVEIAKTTTPFSEKCQQAFDRDKRFNERDQAFAQQIESLKDDPIEQGRAKLMREHAQESHSAETCHAASNVSRAVGDKDNDKKFAGLGSEHEAKRDALADKLTEYNKLHPEKQNGLESNKDRGADKQANPKENAVPQKNNDPEMTAGQKKIIAMQKESGEKNHVPVTEEHKQMARAYKERASASEKEMSRTKERETEKER